MEAGKFLQHRITYLSCISQKLLPGELMLVLCVQGTPTGLNPNAKSFVPRGASEYQQSAPSVRPAEPVSYQAQPLTTFQPSVPAHPQVNGQQREISYMDHRQASMLWYNYSQQPVSLQQRPVYGTPIQNHTPHSLQGPALYLTSPTFRPPQVVAPPPIQTKPNPQVQPVTSLVEPPSLTTHPPSSPSDSSSPTVDSDMGLEVVGFSMPDNTAVLTKSPAVVMPRPPHRNTTILPTNGKSLSSHGYHIDPKSLLQH